MNKESLAKLLENGELTSVDNVGPEKIEMCSVGVLAKATPEKIWKAITDFESYGKLMPDFTTPEVFEHTDKTALVHFTVTVLKLSLLNITTDYTLRYKFDAPRRADISWVSGKVKNISGYWELIPVHGGKKTIVIYAITSDLGSANPLVGAALKEQPATVMAINLSSAIVLTRLVVKKAESL
jgi:ribosome-associated toxin RatA of RatAB toxin-antitoxin module